MRQLPVTLGEVLGVGRAKDDRLLVVDSTELRLGLLVSGGGALERYTVLGTGSQTTPSIERYSLSSRIGSTRIRVLLEQAGAQVRMMLIEGETAADRVLDISAAQGELLEIVDAASIRSLPLRAMPSAVKVEYAARVDPDDYLVVVGPEDFVSYDDYELFFGPPDKVSQREISNFLRGRDGGSTMIQFPLDGGTANAFFPNRIQRDGPPITEPVTFEVDGESRSITNLPREVSSVEHLSFECSR